MILIVFAILQAFFNCSAVLILIVLNNFVVKILRLPLEILMIHRILGTEFKNHTMLTFATCLLEKKKKKNVIGFRGFKHRGHYIMLPTELLDPESLLTTWRTCNQNKMVLQSWKKSALATISVTTRTYRDFERAVLL